MCFLICFKRPATTDNETQSKGHWRHSVKGVMGKGKTRQQPKICHLLLMLGEMFGPVIAVRALLLPVWQSLLYKKGVKMTHRSDEVKALVTCQATPATSQSGCGAVISSRQLGEEQGCV